MGPAFQQIRLGRQMTIYSDSISQHWNISMGLLLLEVSLFLAVALPYSKVRAHGIRSRVSPPRL
jgi:hypothetical protein